MPKIIGLTEQQSALREISAAVKKMDGINDFLNTPNPEGKYTISFEAGGKRHQTSRSYTVSLLPHDVFLSGGTFCSGVLYSASARIFHLHYTICITSSLFERSVRHIAALAPCVSPACGNTR